MLRKVGMAITSAAAGILLTVGIAFAAMPLFGSVHLHPIKHSGIMARVHMLDTGSALHVIGIAKGLDPNKRYISLIYDNGSAPSGPNACEETNNSLNEQQMFVGEWVPMGNSIRTLSVEKTGASYTPLTTFRTMSVRVDEGSSIQDPKKRFVLQACGLVHKSQ